MNRAPSVEALRAVRMFVFDVDGVLTDGRLVYGDDGETAHAFDVRDGFAIVRAPAAGLIVGIISGRRSAQVARRLRELRITHIHQGVDDKAPVLRALCERTGVPLSAVAYTGDDVNDLPAMRIAGLAACPADAVPEVRGWVGANGWLLDAPGGRGAARQLLQAVMQARGSWHEEAG